MINEDNGEVRKHLYFEKNSLAPQASLSNETAAKISLFHLNSYENTRISALRGETL